MQVKIYGSSIWGVDAITITIEVNVYGGLKTYIVGLPDLAVRESILRIESALKSNGMYMPRTKVVINLAPADIRKTGASFDLPIALGILGATEQLPQTDQLQSIVVMGEMGLDGRVLPISGVLPMAMQAAKEGFRTIMVPDANAHEAALVEGITTYGISHLLDVVKFLENNYHLRPATVDKKQLFDNIPEPTLDFADVKGQQHIKRALEIAAAGGHNSLLIGSPGAGKTMLAKRFPGILPPLSIEEALETSRIHSVAGKLLNKNALIVDRPFRSPHHSISGSALSGGGIIPHPGEISLAHNGVLFLDELPEFKRNVLEMMRQPMEARTITISRAKGSVAFPAGFMLLASMNPCPCGFHNHPLKECHCTPLAVERYLQRISGPLLDRIDLHVEVTPPLYEELFEASSCENTLEIRARVMAARALQAERFNSLAGTFCNAQLNGKQFTESCKLPAAGQRLLKAAMEKLHLSARAYDRIIKVSRTIADLAGMESIAAEHVAEAIQYRSLDKSGWG